MKPNFFIVGQTRSGTTSLFDQLRQHPDVFIIHTGTSITPSFFSFEPTIKRIEDYLELFSNAETQKCVGEKNTDNLMCKESAYRIKEFFPNSKIIINLRNPIDVMFSLHNLNVNSRVVEKISNFEEALNAEKNRLSEEKKNSGKYSPNVFYRKNVQYVKQISRYFELFGRQNVLVRIFEDYVTEPKKSFKEVCEFLEIDSKFIPEFTHRNSSRIARNKAVQSMVNKTQGSKFRNLIKKIPSIQQAYNFVNLPQFKDDIEANLLIKLCEEFKPQIDELSILLDRDLSSWYEPKS